jgi:KaiC/GvpD/RAD55 family RecA-like ATPase
VLKGLTLALLLASTVGLLLVGASAVHATNSTPQNNRLFYLSPPRSLGTTIPPSSQNYTFKGTPVSFLYGSLEGPLTVSGPITFSLWINMASSNTTASATVLGTFDYKFPGLAWNNVSQASSSVTTGLTEVNATYNIGAGTPLTISTELAIEVNVTSIPNNANVTLDFGARPVTSQIPSHIGLVLSGYASMPVVNPVLILDRSGTQTTTFNLNPGPGNNIVLIEASAYSAFGLSDISLNLTILDPNLHPVSRATNITMTSNSQPTNPQPYTFFATWLYPANSTQGTYQVRIDIIDSQSNTAYTFGGLASFALVPPGYVPFPYNLIPYFIVGGVSASGGVTGALLYRKRRSRSYLVPFDHFNNLTGGELTGGTIVTIEGNTGSGKTLLLEQLLAEDLRKGRPCVYVTTGDFPDSVRSNMKTMGIEVTGYEQRGLLTFVDGYSAEAGQESKERISIPSLSDFTTLSIKLSSAFPSPSFKGGSLYFDSLTPLASKARPESIVSLVQSVGAKVKGLGGKAFFAVGLGIDITVQRQLEDTTDCIVQMEAFEEAGSRKRRLRIAKFRARKHQDSWALFTIEEGKGIIFYSKKPRQ